MEQILVLGLLVIGLIGAWKLTQLFNWYAWGEKKEEKKMRVKKMQGRGASRENNDGQ